MIYFTISLLTLFMLLVVYFFIIKHLDNKIQTSNEVLISEKNEGISNFIIPTHFVDGERFYVKLPISNNEFLMAFGDTGGGITFLAPNAIKKGDIQSNLKMGIVKGIMPIEYILYKDLVKNNSFPIPNPNNKFIIRNPFNIVTNPLLMIPPMEDELKFMFKVQPEMEAFLGQTFFMDHSWTIDYPNEQLMVNTPISDSLINHPNVQKLGFKKNTNQEKLNGHPSMTIEIDGETIDVLFDTGATMVLTEDGKKQFKTNKKTLAGSFIAVSIFNKWRKEHPDWKYYPKADYGGDVIEVPIVKIGKFEVGPVLFVVKRDEAWSEGMINTMDKVVKGAIGGTFLKYFKVTIDYNTELIQFER